MRLLTYNYFINKYIFNNQICKYNNYIPQNHKSFIFNTTDDVKNFIQYYHFKNHDFGDLNLADEIVINDGTYNKTWLIAGFNTQLDSDVKNGSFGKHHLILIPKQDLLKNTNMHKIFTHVTTFDKTDMFTKTLPDVNNNLFNILDNYLLPQKIHQNNIKSHTVKATLLDKAQLFPRGTECELLWNKKYVNLTNIVDGVCQVPLFNINSDYKVINELWWLRDYYSDNRFCVCTHTGMLYSTIAGMSHVSLRPYICLGNGEKNFHYMYSRLLSAKHKCYITLQKYFHDFLWRMLPSI